MCYLCEQVLNCGCHNRWMTCSAAGDGADKDFIGGSGKIN